MLRHGDAAEAHPHPHPHPEKPLLSPTNGVTPAAPAFPQPEKQVHLDGIVQVTNNVTVAAKALRQKNSEALVNAIFSIVLSAKTLAVLLDDDPDVVSWTKALEVLHNQLRTNVDGGKSGHELYSEISTAVGQLYLSVIAHS